MHKLIIVIFLFISQRGFCGECDSLYIDSLKAEVERIKNDSIKIEKLFDLDYILYVCDPDEDLEVNLKISDIAYAKLTTGESTSNFFATALAQSHLNVGLVYLHRGDYYLALDELFDAFNAANLLVNRSMAAKALINIGSVYAHLKDLEQAERFYKLANELSIKDNNKGNQLAAIGSLGAIYEIRAGNAEVAGDIPLRNELCQLAMNLILEGMNIAIEIQDEGSYILSLLNKGTVLFRLGKFEEAHRDFTEALARSKEIDSPFILAEAYYSLGMANRAFDNYIEAIRDARLGLAQARVVNSKDLEMKCHKLLYESYRELDMVTLAYKHLKIHISLKDSLLREENQSKGMKLKYQLQYERKTVADSIRRLNQQIIQEAEIAQKEAGIKSGKTQSYALLCALVIGLLLLLIVYRRLQRKKRESRLIQLQRQHIEHHRNQIVDSINYAERIQKSILPNDEDIRKHLKNFSRLYLPKDIVSGDFYWFTHHKNSSYLVLADCTGHGVPGGFMSMIGAAMLNDIILGIGLERPDEILERLDRDIKELLNQESEESSDDGMDVTIVRIDHSNNKLEFSGANQHLYLQRTETEIIRGDLRSIGGWVRDRSRLPKFKTKSFDLKEIESFFLSSDGLEDQFNEANKEQFGRHRFLDFLNSIKDSDLTQLAENFQSWRGQAVQTDDVCVLGVKL